MVMGAYGAAIIASKSRIEKTKFRGKEVSAHPILTKGFECGDCPNYCEIIEVLDDDEIIGRTGGQCGKWEGRTEPRESLKGTGPRGAVSGGRKGEQETCRRLDDVPDLIQIGVFKK